jgi:hypothetical protein
MPKTTKFGVNARVQVIDRRHPLCGEVGLIKKIGINEKARTFSYVLGFGKNWSEAHAEFPEEHVDFPRLILPPGVG